uniref:B30.2/SPRY domain-containing protein n=1 Tax=Cyprinus carpio TaxID=7962 RepID=A0A8C1Y1X1_CYPCA
MPSYLTYQRAPCPEPSCVSMKSENSIYQPPKFSNEAVTSDSRMRQTATSPASSCVSIKSNDSIVQPPNLCNGTVTSNPVLSGCMVTEEGCFYLALALRANPSHLRELDLSYNNPGDSGVKLLSDILEDPHCKLEKLNVDHAGEVMITAGLCKYACDLTLDPNTVNIHLCLTEQNRKVTRLEELQSYPDHPERFDYFPQVLCRESLSGRCYWEVEWSGWRGAVISVAHREMSRKGGSDDCRFGFNEKSWSLDCSDDIFTVWHNKKSIDIAPIPFSSKRVGVFLNWKEGTLSFYSVYDTHTLTHLHTFYSTFTKPLCAGFRVFIGSSVSLRQIEKIRNNGVKGISGVEQSGTFTNVTSSVKTRLKLPNLIMR